MKQYSIGTTREDARETFLVDKGFDIIDEHHNDNNDK